MKKILMLSVLALSFNSFASGVVREFDPSQEKSCHNELKQLGCVNSNGEADESCANAKMPKLSSSCRAMQTDKNKMKQ